MPRGEKDFADEVAGDALAALVPVVGGAIGSRAVRAVREEWRRNASRALRAAEAASGMTRESLAEFIEREPRAIPLYIQVLWAAGSNGHDETLRAMGAVFGRAASASAEQDDDGLEDAELALRAMSALGPRHFRVLRALSDVPLPPEEDEHGNHGASMSDGVAASTGIREEIVDQVLLNLAGAGLARPLSVWGGVAYPISDLGRAVVRAVQEVADGPTT